MTSLEVEVLDTLRSGGVLTLSTIAKHLERPKWLVRRAASSLRKQSLVWENRRGEWQAYRAGRTS